MLTPTPFRPAPPDAVGSLSGPRRAWSLPYPRRDPPWAEEGPRILGRVGTRGWGEEGFAAP